MKKLALVFVLVAGLVTLNSCTDNSLEELEIRNEEQSQLQLVDPTEDPNVDTDPDDETGNE
ncbi:hypothetical protein SAMN04489761_3011 [Tenacibaculum sp. MAR_2009_124]|uniref:hypothetical protein n=1 Tax=Tenacibaculum sp. MAR_2009_124 TaxID=1250059 RepID=UPI000898521B|nr:hypothetical protein [Tenacibaculum sp. MAR_2009_124]SEC44518.1 hypothetical protein SAMN04489761_3011 [Tenacibaculum sp. MAR_2009_124]